MSDISKIKVSGVEYGIKDIQARGDLGNLGTRVTELEQHGGGGGAITTLHINVTAVNRETMEATFTADKTPSEMQEAAATGPTWCVVSFAAGTMAQEAVSIGVPPTWYSINPAFGQAVWLTHEDGNNKVSFVVAGGPSDTWIIDLTAFRS